MQQKKECNTQLRGFINILPIIVVVVYIYLLCMRCTFRVNKKKRHFALRRFKFCLIFTGFCRISLAFVNEKKYCIIFGKNGAQIGDIKYI